MVLRYGEGELRRTGNPADANLADQIKDRLAVRGRDFPFPQTGVITEELAVTYGRDVNFGTFLYVDFPPVGGTRLDTQFKLGQILEARGFGIKTYVDTEDEGATVACTEEGGKVFNTIRFSPEFNGLYHSEHVSLEAWKSDEAILGELSFSRCDWDDNMKIRVQAYYLENVADEAERLRQGEEASDISIEYNVQKWRNLSDSALLKSVRLLRFHGLTPLALIDTKQLLTDMVDKHFPDPTNELVA